MLSQTITLGLLFAALTFFNSVTHAEVIRYPQAGDIYQKHHQYPLELLNLAVEQSKEPLQVQPSHYFMNQGRAIKQLAKNEDIEVMWSMTSIERENSVLPIRIPIYKGLIGWRLLMTNSDTLTRERHTGTLDTLKKMTFIQGHDWPDTEILRANGFNVLTGPDYLGLFKLTSLGRADYFPRSVIEIWDELESTELSNIGIEEEVILSYPTASYFFVSQNNRELASIIEQGLRTAIANGKFDQLFEKHFGERLRKANIKHRTLYKLNNPLLPAKTPLEDEALWFRP